MSTVATPMYEWKSLPWKKKNRAEDFQAPKAHLPSLSSWRCTYSSSPAKAAHETRMGKSPLLDPRKAKLLKEQEGKCPWCGLYFKHGDVLEIDHITALQFGGTRKWDNLRLLHGHCHDDKTATESLLEVPMTAAELSRSRVTGNSHARF